MNFNITESGYDQAQVDAYVARISETYKAMHASHQKLKTQNAELTSDNQALATRCRQQELEIAGLKSDTETPNAAVIGQGLIDAQKLAERIVDHAKREADTIVTDAHKHAEQANLKKYEASKLILEVCRQIEESVKEAGLDEEDELL